MERARDSASSKESQEDASGSFDNGVLIPVLLPTLNILAACFKEGPKPTNIEQFLEAFKKDPVLSGFMEDFFNQGIEMLKEHDAILRRGSLDMYTRKRRFTSDVGEEAITPDGSGNKGETNVDETPVNVLPESGAAKSTAVGAEANVSAVDKLQELDEGEATHVADKIDVDQTDDDETDVDQIDDDETDVGETDDGMDADQMLDPPYLIEELIHDLYLGSVAKRIANDKVLIGITNELLEPLRNADGVTRLDAQQHSEAVARFWKNEHFHKGLYEEVLENFFLVSDFVYFSKRFIAESTEDRMIRIKADPSLKKVLDADDPVVRMSGVLSIIMAYWINNDMLVELGKAMDGPDVPASMKSNLAYWSRRR